MAFASKTALVAVALCAACVATPPPADNADAPAGCDDDGDGYWEDVPGCEATVVPHDCADDDENRHPGALDICDNTIDEDYIGGDVDCTVALVPNTLTTDSTEITIQNGFAAITFDGAQNYAITELVSVKTASNNLLYDGPLDERLFSVHMWSDHFSWNTFVQPTWTLIDDGPAAVRVRVQWVAGNGVDDGMTGDTYYTVFPDGRLHRDENLEVLETAVMNNLTAHLSLEPTEFTHLDWDPGDHLAYDVSTYPGSGLLFPFGDTPNVETYLSSHSCGYSVDTATLAGLAWRIPAGSWDGPRVSVTDPGAGLDHALALQFDWHFYESFGPESARGDFLVYVDQWLTPVPDDLGTDPCGPMNLQAAAFIAPVSLTPSGTTTLHTGDIGDDDADGYYEGGGFWDLDAGGGDEISFAVDTGMGLRAAPATSVFRLRGLDTSHLPTVYIDNRQLEHGREYLHQTTSGVSWVYLAIPLANDNVVRFAAP